MTTTPIHQRFLPVIRFLGPWTSLCLAFFVVVFSISYARVGSIKYTNNQALVDLAVNQRLLTEQITSNALAIELAVRTDDWSSVEPTFLKLRADHTTWQNSHSSLLNSSANSFHAKGDEDSIAEHLSKLAYPYKQINQSITELEIVTESVVRRAPYIDPKSVGRIAAAVESFKANNAGFNASYEKIITLYQLHAGQSSGESIASIRKTLFLSFFSIVLAIASGIAPRLWRQNAQITALRHENDRAKKALADLTPSQPVAESEPDSDSSPQTPPTKLAA